MQTETNRSEWLVVFSLAGREYAVAVEHVAEIVPMVALAPVPEAPEEIAGLMNLRGDVIPVVDLRTRLGLPRTDPTLDTPIVVASNGGRSAGLIVEPPAEVLRVPASSMSGPGERVGMGESIRGAATSDDRLILVLDVAPVLVGAERFVPAVA